jgi:hypothetical protein
MTVTVGAIVGAGVAVAAESIVVSSFLPQATSTNDASDIPAMRRS